MDQRRKSERHYFWYFLLGLFFFLTPGVALLLLVRMSALYHAMSSRTSLPLCVCVRPPGANAGAPEAARRGYVWKRGSKVLAGLSGLLMTAIDRTSRTPSPRASHTTSSSTTLTPGSLTPPPPASPRLQPWTGAMLSGSPDNILTWLSTSPLRLKFFFVTSYT